MSWSSTYLPSTLRAWRAVSDPWSSATSVRHLSRTRKLKTPLAHPVRSDVTDMTDLATLAKQASDTLSGIDYLFVTQGIAEFQTLEEVTEESWDRIFSVNTKGSFFTVQQLAPLIAEGGSIVFTTVSNDEIFPGLSACSGAKEAVAAFAKVLAAELLPRGIRVNAVAPGFILTPTMGVAELTTDQRAEFIEQGNASTPMGRGGTVEEIASAALYLAVDATFATGIELPVDGGFGKGLGH
nr:SDR family oxidoreductase [Kribbella solani]